MKNNKPNKNLFEEIKEISALEDGTNECELKIKFPHFNDDFKAANNTETINVTLEKTENQSEIELGEIVLRNNDFISKLIASFNIIKMKIFESSNKINL